MQLRLKLAVFIVFMLFQIQAKSQCIALIDQAGDTSTNPTYTNCIIGSTPANVTLSILNVYPIVNATINWGDGTAVQNFPGGILAGAVLSHVYSAAIDTYLITITQSAPFCTIQAHFVNERSVIAQIAPLAGSVTTICAPNIIQFVNKSTNVSKTTVFTLDFGDGTPVITYDYTNAGDTIPHMYLKGRVGCNTIVTLTARNNCTGSLVSTNTYGPIQVYDKDSAIINANKTILCYPDTTVTFTNNTIRNCVLDGNTQQRFERWIIKDFKGVGVDSVSDWIPWPPSSARVIRFPGGPTRPKSYSVWLLDSSMCGIDTAIRSITIIDPPNAFFTSADTVCGGTSMTFTNGSTPGMTYAWNFGDGNTSGNTNPTHSFTNTGATILPFNVRLIVTNPAGFSCADTFIKTIYVLPRPTSNFSQNGVQGNISACDSVVVTFADLSINASSWSWDFDNNGTVDFVGQSPPPQKFLQTRTVSLLVVAANGCSHSRTRTITIFTTPAADFNVTSVCVNQVASFQNTSSQFPGNNITTRAWNFGDPASGANNTSTLNNPTHTFSTPGSYNVRLIIQSQNGCPDTMIKQLNVQFPPTANFSPTVSTGCSPLAVTFNNTTLNADPSLYVWKIGNAPFSTSTSSSRTFINTGTSNDTIRVKLVAQTTFGCKDSITKTIVVFPNPVAGIAANVLPSCTPTPINFLSASTGAISFNWNFDDGNTSTLPNPIHQFANNTNQIKVFNVSLIITSANTCKDTAVLPVIVFPDQTFVVSTNVDSGCSPVSVKFPSFPGIVNYQWEFGDALSSSEPSPLHTYSNLSNTTVNYVCRGILTNAFGCTDTVYKTIKVKPVPSAMYSPDNAFICSEDTVRFTNSSALSATHFKWYFGDGDSLLTNSNAMVKHYYINNTTAPIEYTTELYAYNSDTCFRSHSLNVTVYPRVHSSFQIDTLQCSPYTALADNRSLNGNKFYWYINNSLVDSIQNKSFILTNSTASEIVYDIKLRSISLFGCISDTVVKVRVSPQPNASFITDVSSGCEPLFLNFTNQSTPGINYHWDFGDGETSLNASTTFTKTYINTSKIPIEYTAQLAVENAFNCVDTFRRKITVYPNLSAVFNLNDTSSCSPLIMQTSNNSKNSLSYAWFVDNVLVDTNANPLITIVNSSAVEKIAVVKLIATSAYGCTAEYSKNVHVLAVPVAEFFIPNATVKFPQNTFSFVNQNVQSGFNYKWYFGDGDSAMIANPSSHTYTNPGTYNVMLIVSNAQCSDTLVHIARIDPPTPVVSFTGKGVGCAPLSVSFTNNSRYASSYEWDFGDGIKSNEENPTHTYLTGGTYSISLIARGDGGQALDVHVDSVEVYNSPNAFFVAQPKVIHIPSDPLVLFNLSQSASQFYWDFGDGFTSTEVSPTHYYLHEGEYTISLISTNTFGCTDTFIIEKAVKAESGGSVVVPNAFTPNENGGNGGKIENGVFNNDVFHPVVEGAEHYIFEVYNRWGELLFRSEDVNTGWDGYYKGVLCKQDVYVWKVELFFSDGSKKIKSGDLLLLR